MAISLELYLDDDSVVRRFVKDLIRIGRIESNDFQISDRRVSSHHAQIQQAESGYQYVDMGSKNGSMLMRANQEIAIRPHTPYSLELGDEILLGDKVNPIKMRVRSFDKELFSRDTLISKFNLTPQIKEEHLTQLIYQLGLEEHSGNMVDYTIHAILNKFVDFTAILHIPFDPKLAIQDAISAFINEKLNKTHVYQRKHDSIESSAYKDVFSKPNLSLMIDAFQQRKIGVIPFQKLTAEGHSILRNAVILPLHVREVNLGFFLVESLKATDIETLDWLRAVGNYLSVKLYLSQKLTLLHQSENELKEENQLLKNHQYDRRLMGESSSFKKVLQLLEKVSKNQAIVLFTGQHGTGKELAARYLSYKSSSSFTLIHCKALTEEQLEMELFGSIRHTSQGVIHKEGALSKAKGGVVFLNEIQEMPLSLQAKLLHVIKSKEVLAVGGQQVQSVKFRLITSSSEDLEQRVRDGLFLMDLYYLISVFPIHMPKLSERKEDIPMLSKYFKELAMSKHDTWIGDFTDETLDFLSKFDWPGNISQLENEIERVVLVYAGAEQIDKSCFEHLRMLQGSISMPYSKDQLVLNHYDQKEKVTAFSKEKIIAMMNEKKPLKEIMDSLEELVIRIRLNDFSQNRTRAAQSLELSRQALQAKLANWRKSEQTEEEDE
jgi:sigma-54-specific transcriptional regulator